MQAVRESLWESLRESAKIRVEHFAKSLPIGAFAALTGGVVMEKKDGETM